MFQRQPVRDIGADFSGLRPFRECPLTHFAERRIFARGFPRADAEHARALDQHQIGAGKPDAAGESDYEDARAPGNAAQAVFENLAADGIEYHIRTAAIGDALDGVAERLTR